LARGRARAVVEARNDAFIVPHDTCATCSTQQPAEAAQVKLSWTRTREVRAQELTGVSQGTVGFVEHRGERLEYMRDTGVTSSLTATSRIFIAGLAATDPPLPGSRPGDVYQRDVSVASLAHIAGVILFGDPYFNPKDALADRGGYQHNGYGVLGRRRSFGRDRSVVSYCHPHDPVCHRPSVRELLK
jgi:hypothetical protein